MICPVIKEAIMEIEKKNVECLIELHKALDMALSQRNWELVAFCLDNIEEYMKSAIIGVNVMEME